MNLSIRRTTKVMLVVVAAGTLGAVVACADAESSVSGPDLSNDADSGGVTTLPEAAAAPEDAGAQEDAEAGAPRDAEADAPLRVCSDDNFCHSVLPGKHVLRGVWGDGQGIVWAISQGGTVLRWDGNAWTEHTTGLAPLTSIWGSGATDIWLVASSGTVYHGTGASSAEVVFSPEALPGDQSVRISSLWGSGPDDVWAVGGKEADDFFGSPTGRALHYTRAGGWTVDDDLSARGIAYEYVWGSAASGVWLVGPGQRDMFGWPSAPMLRRAAGASDWVQLELPPNPTADFGAKAESITRVDVLPGNSMWAVGRTGTGPALWRGESTDNGQTIQWSFVQVLDWEPRNNAFWGSSPNDVWAVGQPGRVARWSGTKWLQAAIRVTNTPVTTAFYGIWGTSSDDFWVVGDNAALHKTTGAKP